MTGSGLPPLRSVRHVGAAVDPSACPSLGLPEIAFAGRSNVGKSALLNALCGVRGLARVSGRPGRTRELQFFVMNEALALVDLPGYGYASVSRATRAGWRGLVEGYLARRKTLRAVVLVLDVRRNPGEEERALTEWLRARGIAMLPVATKCDKISKAALFGRLRALEGALGPGAQRPLAFSAPTGVGREALWKALAMYLAPEERIAFWGEAR
jgi:GTP-binding protein